MHTTVPVECLGENYFCFLLFKIINYVCDCVKEICPAYVADSIHSSCISWEYAENNIIMDTEEMDLMIVRSEKKLIST